MNANALIVIAIYGDKEATRFLQACDALDSFKIIAKPTTLSVALEPGCTLTQAIESVKELLTNAGQRVAAVFIPNNPEGAWRDESVRAISDGTHWRILDDCLDAYGFVGKTPAELLTENSL